MSLRNLNMERKNSLIKKFEQIINHETQEATPIEKTQHLGAAKRRTSMDARHGHNPSQLLHDTQETDANLVMPGENYPKQAQITINPRKNCESKRAS